MTYRDLIRRPDVPFDGIWPRVAALPARQALETAMGELWASSRRAAGMSGCPCARRMCLTAYLDPGPASRAVYLLAALSQACHYHPYELPPTAAELTGWLDQATQVLTQI